MAQASTTWIIQSGQIWKLYVALAGFVGTLLCFILAAFSLAGREGLTPSLTACGLFLGISTFVWLTLALRCPHCMTKLVLKMIATRPHSSWLIDLAALESCPVCHRSLMHGGRSAT